MISRPITSVWFRELFPTLRSTVRLDTLGASPGSRGRLTDQARAISLWRVTDGPESHIVALHTAQADHLALRLREHGVRATLLSDRIRFGFHYFNEEPDVVATVRVLRGVG
ncbi:hypothetical protein [Nonomuraea aurantiaca]|uniref:hypothetical protein n=1 Tax=Nonomuraea aurantiaca TaxID=2878562 RepID=UPI001CD924C5|nr:hypothetical protein [Nonomuraea aurantiaca]MCA2227732.1 hypothetical protein [Nonomuraea aurantiaca]